MPRKQRGGATWWPFGNENNDKLADPLDKNDHITNTAKHTAQASVETIAETALAGVSAAEGVAKGAAEQSEQATLTITGTAVKDTGVIGKEAIETTTTLAVAELQGISEGGKIFVKEFTKHALFAAKDLGVAALMSAGSAGKAIESQEVQTKIEAALKYLMEAGLLTTEDVALIAVLITKTLATTLIKAVARAGGGRRRRTHRSKRRHLKRRTAKHR
jgi:hypothetical protein